jgi:hypothetical protein
MSRCLKTWWCQAAARWTAAVAPAARAWALLALAGAAALPVQAHKPSDSYLRLQAVPAEGGAGTRWQGQWDIALRDLDHALGLDADGNAEITWGELRQRHGEIAAYALARLELRWQGQPCRLRAGPQWVDEHSDGAYTVLPIEADCSATAPAAAASAPAAAPQEAAASAAGGHAAATGLELRYRLFADLDAQHRGLLSLQWQADGPAVSAVFGPAQAVQHFEPGQASGWRAFGQYLVEGVWHIWIGFDHILFLLSLLLPAVLVWRVEGRHWVPVQGFRRATVEVLKIVTAFTLAHSLTLSLAALGWLSLPARWVESAIAASVVLAALNNLWPWMQQQRWSVALAFGLVHGFGFASVLAELGLPQQALATALLGFNVGVELGQLAIVAVFLPLAYALRATAFYRWGVMVGGSVLIALLAAAWFADRAFGLSLAPF